jgi:hypothetical protein
MPSSAPSSRWARHLAAAAGWRCTDCQRQLCVDCVVSRRVHVVDFLVCELCGGRAEVLRRHRSAQPFGPLLLAALRFPLRPGSLPVLLGMAILLAVFKSVAALVLLGAPRLETLWAVAPVAALQMLYTVGVTLALLIGVVRQTSRGSEELSPPELTELFPDVIRPTLLGLLGMGWVLVCILWRVSVLGAWDPGDVGVRLLAAFAVAYAPWVLLLAAADAALLQLVNPFFVVGAVVRTWEHARWVLGLFAVLVLPGALFQLWALRLWTAVPVLGAVLGELLALYVPLVLARALGCLLRVRGDTLGHGREEDYLEAVLPDATPRHAKP